jgi:hypothetical protein
MDESFTSFYENFIKEISDVYGPSFEDVSKTP